MNRVFDASALLAFLRDETGADVVEEILSDPQNSCHIHHAQVTEVYWIVCRDADEDEAEAAVDTLTDVGISICGDFELEFCKQASRWRALTHMSLGDAFGLTLTQRLGGDFVTTDRGDLEVVHTNGWLPITFVRPLPRSHSKRTRLEQRLRSTIQALHELDIAEGVEGGWRQWVKGLALTD
jgi:PIN domain nuclease of toxin-antitoxin system